MPLQIWTRDQVPELMVHGAQSLGAGIAGGGQAIAQAIDQAKKEHQEGKAAETFFNSLPTDQQPMTTAEFKNLAAGRKSAMVKGMLVAQGYQRAHAELADLLAQANGRQEAAANAARFPDFANDLTSALQPTNAQMENFYEPGGTTMPQESQRPQSRQASLADILASAGRTRYNPGSQTDDLLRAINSGHSGNTGDFMPLPFEVGGQKGLVSPRTGSMHLAGNSAQTFEQRVQLLDRKGLLDEKRTLLHAHGQAFTKEDKAYYQAQIDAIDAKLKAGVNGGGSTESRPTTGGASDIGAAFDEWLKQQKK